MTELELKIKAAQDAYYNGDAPIMSDIEFDELWDKLKKEQPESELLKMVGSDHTDGFKKVKHSIIMGSQNKVNTAEEVSDWLRKNKIKKEKVIVQHKMDGISVALYYKNGKFAQAVSRGDGETGDDITANVAKMKGVTKSLSDDFSGTVRGEILLSRTDKEKYYPEMKNCRNAASGISKRKDGEGCNHLSVVVYDAQYSDGTSFETQENLQNWLKKNGFTVAKYDVVEKFNAEKVMKILAETFDNYGSLDFDIDGLVLKQNEIDMDDIKTNYRPKTNVALKPARQTAVTTLRSIEWRLYNGTFTPVGNFDAVELCGTKVENASLSNIAAIEDMGLEIGHEIVVTKCGCIIPKIMKKKKSFKGVKDTNITYVLEKNIQKINKMTKANEIADFLEQEFATSGISNDFSKYIIETLKASKSFEKSLKFVYEIMLTGENLGTID